MYLFNDLFIYVFIHSHLIYLLKLTSIKEGKKICFQKSRTTTQARQVY